VDKTGHFWAILPTFWASVHFLSTFCPLLKTPQTLDFTGLEGISAHFLVKKGN